MGRVSLGLVSNPQGKQDRGAEHHLVMVARRFQHAASRSVMLCASPRYPQEW